MTFEIKETYHCFLSIDQIDRDISDKEQRRPVQRKQTSEKAKDRT